MDPITLAAIGGSILNLGAAAFGEWWASADTAQRKALQQQAAQVYASMDAPTLERLKAQTVGESALTGLPKDFGNQGARNEAIRRMIQMGTEGGMDAQSQLAVEQARRSTSQQAQQAQQAIQQQFQRRGLGGAGEASLQLQAAQSGADRASMADMQAAADARARALQALAQGGGMAGQAEQADSALAARVAESRDRVAQFNAQQAQEAARYNSQLGQQEYENRLGLADRRYGSLQTQAGQYETEAQRKRRMVGDVGQSFGRSLGVASQYMGGETP